MSDQTKAAMDAAIAAHVADETDGDLLANYILQATTTSIDLMDADQTGFIRFCTEHQSWVTSLGLIDYARTMMHSDMIHDED